MSIRKTLSTGIVYTALSRYSGIFLSIFIGAILARLLAPDKFGIVAIVTVFITFFDLLSDFGLGPAVIQNSKLTDEDVQSIFFISILFGVVLALAFFCLAPVISNFYEKPELIKISRLLSLAILFYSLQIIPKALAQKALKFKQIGIISVPIQFASGICAIILAWYGFSYYALVFQSIFVAFFSLIAFYLFSPIKINIRIKLSSIRKILRFSSFQFLFNFINYFSRNADNLLIGKFFGSSALGYYDKSYRLMMMPVSNLTFAITPVLMPVLSKYQDDKQTVYNTYLKVVKILATIGFPLSAFLYFSASEIVNILYVPQWGESIPVFKLLALTVGIQMVLSSTGSIFQAVNRTDLLFYSGFISAIFMVGSISYGIFIGKSLEAVGYGLLVAFSVNFLQGFYMLINHALKFSFLHFFKVFLFPVLISMGVTLALMMVSKYSFSNTYYSFIVKILVAGSIFGIIYFSSGKNRKWLKQKLNIISK